MHSQVVLCEEGGRRKEEGAHHRVVPGCREHFGAFRMRSSLEMGMMACGLLADDLKPCSSSLHDVHSDASHCGEKRGNHQRPGAITLRRPGWMCAINMAGRGASYLQRCSWLIARCSGDAHRRGQKQSCAHADLVTRVVRVENLLANGVSGFGFQVSDLGFRVSGFGFRVSGFEFSDENLLAKHRWLADSAVVASPW
jgi:hypothetical protein